MKDFHTIVSALVALPSSLQNELITQWLGLKEVGLLDSALCSKIHRESLLSSWNEEEFTFCDSNVPLTHSLVKWATLRGVRVASVVLSDMNVDSTLCREFLHDNHSAIQSMTYVANNVEALRTRVKTVEELINRCTILRELKLQNIDMTDFDMHTLLTNCSKLIDLKLIDCSNVDLKAIHEYGRQIRILDLSGLKSTKKPAQASDVASFPTTAILHKLVLFNLPRRMERMQLTNFICASVGLKELQIDQLCGSEICNIVRHCPLLRALRADLRFDEEVGIDVDEFRAFAKNMRNMRYLQLSERTSDVHFMTDQLLLELLQCCPELRAFAGNDVGDVAWARICREGPAASVNSERLLPARTTPASTLQVLYMKSIRVATLSQVLSACPRLQELGIVRFADFDATLRLLHGSTVSKLQLHLPFGYNYATLCLLTNLTSLTLIRCVGLTDAHVALIASHNPTLRALRLTQCDLVSDVALANLVSSCAELRTCDVERNLLKPQNIDQLIEEGRIDTTMSFLEMGIEVM